MKFANYTIPQIIVTGWVLVNPTEISGTSQMQAPTPPKKGFDIWKPLRQWIDQLQIKDAKFAHKLCQLIPAQCPFERDVKLFGRTLFHIPPMCKLNPVYDEVVGLRFRALCYLADECGEDISCYC